MNAKELLLKDGSDFYLLLRLRSAILSHNPLFFIAVRLEIRKIDVTRVKEKHSSDWGRISASYLILFCIVHRIMVGERAESPLLSYESDTDTQHERRCNELASSNPLLKITLHQYFQLQVNKAL